MNNFTSKLLFALCGVLALCTLPMTFVWLEIGPLGKAYYGPTVPNVYIKGAYITGKDLAFWGISFAMFFQLVVIMCYAIISILCLVFIRHRKVVMYLATISFVLLALFPHWLCLYVDGVISNSDGAAADLTVHYGSGLIVYGVLFALTLVNIIRLYLLKQR